MERTGPLKTSAPGRACAAIWLVVVALGCASRSSVEAPLPREPSIERVLEVDSEAGTRRNQGTLLRPSASVVREYADALRAIDLAATPPDFSVAWIAHIEAWEALIPYVEAHSDARGEMHALFKELLSDSNPSAPQFQILHDAIWSTWAQVEKAGAR